jgi:hypothetical protein
MDPMDQMDERLRLLFRFGAFNPTHFIISVIHDGTRAEQAAAALRDAGFAAPVDVHVVPGLDVLSTQLAYDDARGVLARLAGLFPAEEQAAAQEYIAEAERGALLMIVKAPEREQRTRARGILAAHGAHAIRYYGENTITDL